MTTGSIRIAMTSDVGLRRKNNQDTGFAQQGVFMVCDGMGGGMGGGAGSGGGGDAAGGGASGGW